MRNLYGPSFLALVQEAEDSAAVCDDGQRDKSTQNQLEKSFQTQAILHSVPTTKSIQTSTASSVTREEISDHRRKSACHGEKIRRVIRSDQTKYDHS